MKERRHFGSVRKRESGRWQVVYWRSGERLSGGTFSTKADAQAKLSLIEADCRRGVWIDPRIGDVTLTEYATTWLAQRVELAIRTRELYDFLLSNHILPSLGRFSIATLAPTKVRAWNAELSALRPSTAAKSYRLLSTILRTAVSDGLIASSPCRVKGAGIERSAERPLATIPEVELLADAMPDPLKLIVLLATWCQLRRGEILGLRRRDVDELHGLIHIEQSRTFTRDGKSLVKVPKTAAGLRTLSVPTNVMPALESHMLHYVGASPEALLFVNQSSEPITAASLQRAWSKARESVGRPDLHLHDLRHTGLTLAAATGATTAELMLRAGHASAEAALRYQHATSDRDRVLADALAELSQSSTKYRKKV